MHEIVDGETITANCENLDASRSHNLSVHIETEHGNSSINDPNTETLNQSNMVEDLTCRKCVFEGKTAAELKTNLDSEHCKFCDFLPRTSDDLVTHTQTSHKTLKVDLKFNDQISLSCNLCEYKCSLNIQLKKHKNKKHLRTTDKLRYSCESCGFACVDIIIMWKCCSE